MKKLWSIFFILLFSFCSKKESPYPHLIVSEKEDVLQLNTKEMIGVKPEVFGFNFTKDTDEKSHVFEPFTVSKNKSKEKEELHFGGLVLNKNYAMPPRDTIIPRMDLQVIVDTTYTISRKGVEYKNHIPKFNPKLVVDEESDHRLMKPFYDEENKLKKTRIECYPVLIYNKSKKDAIVGQSIIQEAKDEKGNWRPIEFIPMGRGGGGCFQMPSKKLFSQRYLGTTIIKYHGNFKTKLRVKYVNQWNVYYSNEFTGYVNKSQFDKKPFIAQYNFWKNNWSGTLSERMDFAFLNYQKHKDHISLLP